MTIRLVEQQMLGFDSSADLGRGKSSKPLRGRGKRHYTNTEVLDLQIVSLETSQLSNSCWSNP